MLPFVSVDDLNAFTGSDYDGTELLVAIALDSSCQVIRDYLGQSINLVRNDTERFDGTGRESIVLTELPVIDVTAVLEDDEELVADDDYVWNPRTGVLWRRATTLSFAWSVGRQNISVTYDHGWAITEDDVVDPIYEPAGVERVPSDIRAVALSLATRTLRASAQPVSAGAGIIHERIGEYAYNIDTEGAATETQLALLDTEKAALDHYRPGVGR